MYLVHSQHPHTITSMIYKHTEPYTDNLEFFKIFIGQLAQASACITTLLWGGFVLTLLHKTTFLLDLILMLVLRARGPGPSSP
jgi:hypothetical protein